jgi:hypothetical protein
MVCSDWVHAAGTRVRILVIATPLNVTEETVGSEVEQLDAMKLNTTS